MTAAPTLTLPPRTQPLDVLEADLKAIDAAILALRLRVVEAIGRDAFELQRYVDEAVHRRAEVEVEIASLTGAAA